MNGDIVVSNFADALKNSDQARHAPEGLIERIANEAAFQAYKTGCEVMARMLWDAGWDYRFHKPRVKADA